MKRLGLRVVFCLLMVPAIWASGEEAEGQNRFKPIDVFGLEWASDPQISPDGRQTVYVRNFMDIMTDRRRSNLWMINNDGTEHRPLTTGNQNDTSPRWSPQGDRIAYLSKEEDDTQIYARWVDTGQTAKLTNLTREPSGLSWSADGRYIAFSMLVPEKKEPLAKMPPKPEGAEWAEPVRLIEKMLYRADGQGFLEDGYQQLFVLASNGATPRQVTTGHFRHQETPRWTPDGKFLIFSANRHSDWEHDPRNSEIYEVSLADGTIKALTDRQGPDGSPAISPDGRRIAYLGYDDVYHFYQVTRLYVMNRDGSNPQAH